MSLINWREEFSVGVVEVDYEHQELIDLINLMHRSVREGVTRDQVVEGLGEIYARHTSRSKKKSCRKPAIRHTRSTRRIMKRCSMICATSWMKSKTTVSLTNNDCRWIWIGGSANTSAFMMRSYTSCMGTSRGIGQSQTVSNI